jgi:hypothetical protein
MSKYRPDALSLFYFKDRHEAEAVFNSLIAIDDAIQSAKTLKEARKSLSALQQAAQQKPVKEFIGRLLLLPSDRMKRVVQTAIRRVFTSTHHYESGITNRTIKARRQTAQEVKQSHDES